MGCYATVSIIPKPQMPKKPLPAHASQQLVPVPFVERRIQFIRGHNVMLDRDLAELYGVKAIALRQQVKRNRERFPADFMFQLTAEEALFLVSQSVIPSRRSLGGFWPYVFTQEGVAMLSSVLNSERAVQVNVAVMRAFVQLRHFAGGHKDLAKKIASLERKYSEHDDEIQVIFKAIKKLLEPPPKPKRAIGFKTG
jgi:ORF6N domain